MRFSGRRTTRLAAAVMLAALSAITSGLRLQPAEAVAIGHPTTTSAWCTPSPIDVGTTILCGAWVADPARGWPVSNGEAPAGILRFSSPSGRLSPATCFVYVGTCGVTFTPSHAGDATVVVQYSGTAESCPGCGTDYALTAWNPSAARVEVTARTPTGDQHPTRTTVSCPNAVAVRSTTPCTAIVTDLVTGAAPPSGQIELFDAGCADACTPTHLMIAFPDGDTCSSSPCARIARPTCWTGGACAAVGDEALLAVYEGDAAHASSSGLTTIVGADTAVGCYANVGCFH